MIVMPDGVLPHDYSEPVPDFGSRDLLVVHFGGAARVMTRVRKQLRGADGFEYLQSFRCGSERRLYRVTALGEGRLRPIEVTVVDEMASGAVRRSHYLVQYAGNADAYLPKRSHPTALHGPIRPPPIDHEFELWVIRRAESPIIAASLGHGTAWCTAYRSRLPVWRDYQDGELYVLQGRGSRKLRRTRYQLHIDEHGRIECERHDGRTMGLAEIRSKHPELAGWLGQKRLDADELGGQDW